MAAGPRKLRGRVQRRRSVHAGVPSWPTRTTDLAPSMLLALATGRRRDRVLAVLHHPFGLSRKRSQVERADGSDGRSREMVKRQAGLESREEQRVSSRRLGRSGTKAQLGLEGDCWTRSLREARAGKRCWPAELSTGGVQKSLKVQFPCVCSPSLHCWLPGPVPRSRGGIF